MNTVPVDACKVELSIDKVLDGNLDEDGSNDVSAGDTLRYAVTVINTGAATLTNVVVTDPLLTPDTGVCGTMSPGDQCVYLGTYNVTSDDVARGYIENTATADSEETEPVDASVTVDVPSPELSIEKQYPTNADEDESGDITDWDTLTYLITVTNTGTANLTQVQVTDDKTGLADAACGPEILGPGESCTISVDYMVMAEDIEAGEIVNTATASSRQSEEASDTVTVPTERRVFDDRQPGSALVYPLFDVNNDVGDARATTLKLSNLGPGKIWVHLVRVCGGVKSFGAEGLCQASNRQVELTSGETFVRDVASFFSIDRDNCPTGYIVAYAQKSETDKTPIVWNYLVGSTHMNSAGPLNQRTSGLQAYGFQAIGKKTEPVKRGAGGVQPILPFDGIGYAAPATTYSTDYLASIGQRYTDLVLLTLDVEAGFQNEPTVVALDAWNQKEEYHSGAIEYVCHVKVRLDDEINAAQPGAGVQGGMGFGKASNLGSSYGLLQMTPLTKGHAILGATVEMGGNRQTLRGLWHDDVARPTTFYAR